MPITVAYIPVLHEGYLRFLRAHTEGQPLYLIGQEIYRDYRPLAKDIRRLDEHLVADAIRSWHLCSSVDILTEDVAEKLAVARPAIVAPGEDVSYSVVERFFPRCEVLYDTTFLRWDKIRTAQLQPPQTARQVGAAEAAEELGLRSWVASATSSDWFRRVGAAIRFPSGPIESVANQHFPHPISQYVVGDPRSNFYEGVHIELSTSMHAEARLIADAARKGRCTEGAQLFVTDFPCPPCAKLIAAAGIVTLFYASGYSRLDGVDVLQAAGVEIVHVRQPTMSPNGATGDDRSGQPASAPW